MDRDDPTGVGNTGDWETRTAFTERQVCSNPTGVQAFPLDGGSTEVTHIDTNLGFWCVNQEQSTGQCADFSVRFCCPQFSEGHCEHEGYEWTNWLDRDDPTGDGDYEHRADYAAQDVCETPLARVGTVGIRRVVFSSR